ncbi:hypothetical protein, partial [Stutzerimonas nitrititolerans]|uniref:hypothetical protein n=1 Tax=Stutzerimonas nitrititolerans TaxID=2482751 RepID=UPI0028976A09
APEKVRIIGPRNDTSTVFRSFVSLLKGLGVSKDRQWRSAQLAILASATIVATEARFLLIELCLA